MNSFLALQKRVQRALAEYERFRKELDINEPMLYETIKRESQPFTKGFFTLAVVGEMSAGKSTLINALLGQRGLLPSSYGQTTCVLTEIVHSEKESVEVTYADGKSKVVESQYLNSLVAISDEYENLPVNEINRHIIRGLSFDKIWGKRESLSQLQRIPIDKALLKKYFDSHPKPTIPVKVVVKHPLPEAFRGWKIVDTPGVGAIGGIEKATKDFINGKDKNNYNNVDAIIFVNSGLLQFQRSGFNSFVEDTFETIYEEARRRMFLVITRAADPNFIRYKEQELDRARKLFIEKYKLKEERLICVDSICSMFSEYVMKTKADLMNLKGKDVPNDWLKEDWQASIDARNNFKYKLDEEEKEVNNQNLLKYFNQYSGINELRVKLNNFAEEEKMRVFQSLMKHINKEITKYREVLKKNEETLEKKLTDTKEEFFKKVSEEKKTLEKLIEKKDSDLQKIRDQYNKEAVSNRFNAIDKQIPQLRILDTIYKVKYKAEELLDKVQIIQTDIYNELSKEFEQAFDNLQDDLQVPLPTIDFDSLTKEAHKESIIEPIQPIAWQQKETEGFVGSVERFFGRLFGNKSWGYENDISKPTLFSAEKVDYDKLLIEFKGTVTKEFTMELSKFIDSIFRRIEVLGTEVSKTIDEKVSDQQTKLDKLLKEDNTSRIESEYKVISDKIKNIDSFIETLNSI